MPHAHQAGFESFLVSAALILAALVYLRGWLRVRKLNPGTIASWQAGSFVLGLLFIWIAVASFLAALDHELLTAHMVQHLLLMTLAPPLVWIGAPMKPLTHGLSHRLTQPLIRLFPAALQQGPPSLTQLVVFWLAGGATLVGWHVPSLFVLGLQSEMWHGVEQATFFASGLFFWWPVIQPLTTESDGAGWLILLYLFLATLPCDILSGFLVFCDRVVYPIYSSSSHSFYTSALEDQQYAGALMWTCVTVVYVIAGTILTARLLSPQRSPELSFVQADFQTRAVHLVRANVESL